MNYLIYPLNLGIHVSDSPINIHFLRLHISLIFNLLSFFWFLMSSHFYQALTIVLVHILFWAIYRILNSCIHLVYQDSGNFQSQILPRPTPHPGFGTHRHGSMLSVHEMHFLCFFLATRERTINILIVHLAVKEQPR